MKEINERLTAKSAIIYTIAFLISVGIIVLPFVFLPNSVIGGIIVSIGMIGAALTLSRIVIQSLGTYQHILKTGTEKQIKRANIIAKTIGYGISFVCIILAILVMFIK